MQTDVNGDFASKCKFDGEGVLRYSRGWRLRRWKALFGGMMLGSWVGTAEAVTVRSHSSIDSCVFTIGRFCPVESLGISLVGTLALAVGLGAITLTLRAVGTALFGAKRGTRYTQTNYPPSAQRIDACIKDLKELWRQLLKMAPSHSEKPLALVIEHFSVPAVRYVIEKYPEIAAQPDFSAQVWMLIFTAIIESGTHSAAEVNSARAELSPRYSSS